MDNHKVFPKDLNLMYLKSDVLSMLGEVLIALITEAKHWFSITSNFFLASATSLTAQSSIYLKNQSE